MKKSNVCKMTWAVFLLYAGVMLATPAPTLTTLVNFSGANGAHPQYMAFVQGTDGNFYGTTFQGGTNGHGTIFKITAGGSLTTLHNFAGADGLHPYAGMIQATDGDFYGTTYAGGAHNSGTIFKMTLGGTLTTLHSFDGTDGAGPTCALVQATDGNLYGTTNAGGTFLAGTVFKITPGGALTTLHIFGSVNGDGSFPYAGLIQARNGKLYGTTYGGGANGLGTIFTITLSGMLTTYSLVEGAYPYAPLVQATNGDFYGTTSSGSGSYGAGTVFRFTQAGSFTTLYAFISRYGQVPIAGLVQATDGNFYGSAERGGNSPPGDYGGTLFKITPNGTLTKIVDFHVSTGGYPEGALLQATDGNFYGTTNGGGSSGDGIIFSLSVGLGAFVKTLPTSGMVGASVKILGTDLTSTTSITFNGTAAVFTLVSPSEISTTVPAGATTGKVQVATQSYTLLSNVSFRVTP